MTTGRDDFLRARKAYPVLPVCRELFADADTPVSVYRKVASERAGSFLLESAEQGGVWTSFSFVGAGSFGVLTERDGKAVWRAGCLTEETLLPGGVGHLTPVQALERVYERWRSPRLPGLPPLAGGFVGYVGWDAVREFECLGAGPAASPDLSSMWLSFVSELVVINHRRASVTLIANVLTREAVLGDAAAGDVVSMGDAARGGEADEVLGVAQWRDAQRRLDVLEGLLGASQASPLATVARDVDVVPVRGTSSEEFCDTVAKAKRHIVDGDIFQIVPSQRFVLPNAASALDVYRILRFLNPSPYLYLLSVGDGVSVVGSSPEALVKVGEDGRVLTHPIAGSRPRGADAAAELAHERSLLADEKERAEHLMLVDLARNDLLRVCEPDSVQVTEFMRVERFSHIMHLSSSVEGFLMPGLTPVDVLRATFPAGTLSGAPKPMALRLIDEFESVARGIYGGVVGYFGFSGAADLAIAIRTATLVPGQAIVQAGAGIVADSDPVLEDEECRNKALAPLRAVALANALQVRE